MTIELFPADPTVASSVTYGTIRTAWLDSLGVETVGANPEFRIQRVRTFGVDITTETSSTDLVTYSLLDLEEAEPLVTKTDKGGRGTRAVLSYQWPTAHTQSILSVSNNDNVLLATRAAYVQLLIRWRFATGALLARHRPISTQQWADPVDTLSGLFRDLSTGCSEETRKE